MASSRRKSTHLKTYVFTRESLRMDGNPDNLGFLHKRRKTGEVEILHHGRRAAVLRGIEAGDFLAQVQQVEFAEAQQLMARITGNYKRGNELLASQHIRNRQ
jgi:hypothetical protein